VSALAYALGQTLLGTRCDLNSSRLRAVNAPGGGSNGTATSVTMSGKAEFMTGGPWLYQTQDKPSSR
jgi:hypothetical protein